MQKYLQVFKTKMKDALEYRFDLFFGAFSQLVSLAAVLILWTAVYREAPVFGGFTYAEMVAYFLVARAVQGLLWVGLPTEMEKEIKDGLLSRYLLMPISYLGYWLAGEMAEKVVGVAVTLLFFGTLAFFLRDRFTFQTDPLLLLLFALSVAMAFFINFFLTFTVGLSAFWISEIWSVSFTKDMLHEFLSGGVFPLALLTPALAKAALLLPFAYCVYFPVQLYLGHLSGAEIWAGFGMQAFWVIVAAWLARAVWGIGLKRYEAVGA